MSGEDIPADIESRWAEDDFLTMCAEEGVDPGDYEPDWQAIAEAKAERLAERAAEQGP